jgi:polar amino acid transport system substrate-binding protein
MARKLTFLVALAAAAVAVVAAGCGSDDEEAQPAATGQTATQAANPCAKDSLETKTAGTLTIGTDNPAYPPWFDGGAPSGSTWKLNDPSTGKGFESAVAYAVAEELGFTKDEVEWKVVPFDQSFRPGAKDFDFDINQISFSDERAQAVDFSDSYYDVNQALVALKANKIANAKSIADLHDARLGAPIGTTSYQYIVDNIKPGPKPSVYNTLNDAIAAVKAKQIDGVMVDLPTAFFITAAQLDNSTIVGQFPSAGGEQEHFAMVFEKGSPLVACVDEALARLKDGGRLAEIQQEWLSDKASAPVLH